MDEAEPQQRGKMIMFAFYRLVAADAFLWSPLTNTHSDYVQDYKHGWLEVMTRLLLIFFLTFVVAAPTGRESEVDLFVRLRTILFVFPGVLMSGLLHWKHRLSGRSS